LMIFFLLLTRLFSAVRASVKSERHESNKQTRVEPLAAPFFVINPHLNE
jgi:hypothetical protein